MAVVTWFRVAGVAAAVIAVVSCSSTESMDTTSMVVTQSVMMAPATPLNEGRETFQEVVEGPVKSAVTEPLSTFSIDVDTASYSLVRRDIFDGRRPNPDAVRLEEMINYFDYQYQAPTDPAKPLAVSHEIGRSPWNEHTYLVKVGIKAYEPPVADELPPLNLTFLIDVSGSMAAENKLPMMQKGLGMLINQLRPIDKVSLVVYAGSSGVVLPPTSGERKAEIRAALDNLYADGSTNAGAGLTLAYQQAAKGFIDNGVNRIILVTDGDVNVGTTSFDALVAQVKAEKEKGIHLNTIGVGMGDYRDDLLEQLAVAGEGYHTYADDLKEVRRALVDRMASSLMVVANDVKIQVEFNPAVVDEYRLLGYSNRQLAATDFTNDRVDAAEIGPGHTVTAIYEVHLRGEPGGWLPPLRYQPQAAATAEVADELAFVRVRYKPGKTDVSEELNAPITLPATAELEPSADFNFAVAVAGFGQLLRDSKYLTTATPTAESSAPGYGPEQVIAAANANKGEDPNGDRAEFVTIVKLWRAMRPTQ